MKSDEKKSRNEDDEIRIDPSAFMHPPTLPDDDMTFTDAYVPEAKQLKFSMDVMYGTKMVDEGMSVRYFGYTETYEERRRARGQAYWLEGAQRVFGAVDMGTLELDVLTYEYKVETLKELLEDAGSTIEDEVAQTVINANMRQFDELFSRRYRCDQFWKGMS